MANSIHLSPTLMTLPVDVLRLIFRRLDDVSLIAARSTCTLFQRRCKDLTDRVITFRSRSEFCEKAAELGSFSLLEWARQANGMCRSAKAWDKSTCAGAAQGGHLEVLKWARANGCPWNEWTCANAAAGGHLEVLKWAREYTCPWNLWTCSMAAQGGHLEVLKWARKNKCPWNESTCAQA